MKPFFSIILPTFNRASLLPKAIKSVLAQTFSDWELIIVDDGSTDQTHRIVKDYSNPRIRYYYQENAGRSAARNSGVNLARAEYICFLDSDDYFLENHLESFYQVISAAENKVALFINGMISEKEGKKKIIDFKTGNLGTLMFFFDNVVHSQQVCGHRSIFEKEKFNPTLSIGEDLELWLRIADQRPIIVNEKNTVIVVDHEDRSVNKFRNNPGLGQLESCRVIFENNKKQKEKIPNEKKRELYSNAKAAIGFHYFLHGRRFLSVKFLLLALLQKPKHKQSRFRLYSMLSQIPPFNYFFKSKNVESSLKA